MYAPGEHLGQRRAAPRLHRYSRRSRGGGCPPRRRRRRCRGAGAPPSHRERRRCRRGRWVETRAYLLGRPAGEPSCAPNRSLVRSAPAFSIAKKRPSRSPSWTQRFRAARSECDYRAPATACRSGERTAERSADTPCPRFRGAQSRRSSSHARRSRLKTRSSSLQLDAEKLERTVRYLEEARFGGLNRDFVDAGAVSDDAAGADAQRAV